MKVISIDFDGVLNRGTHPWNAEMVCNLNRISDATGAKLIVHSSWRYGRSLERLAGILRAAGVTAPVIGRCPTPAHAEPDGVGRIVIPLDGGWDDFKGDLDTDHERAIGVQRWLDEHPEVTHYAIIDDMPLLGPFMDTPHFFKTRTHTGLTREIADAIIHHLTRP